jgi:16S rRNA processing protein RimM
MNNDELIAIGVITGKHGLKGLLKIKWYTENSKGLELYSPVHLINGNTHNLKVMFENKGIAICSLEEINNPQEADLLKGKEIFAKRSAFPILKNNNEYYQIDLVGCKVEDIKGKYIGEVTAVYDYGSAPLIEIGEELMIFNNDNFPYVNVEEKKIIIKDELFGSNNDKK